MRTDAAREVAERYSRFARHEAPGRSALYEEWAGGVAADRSMQNLLGRIAASHRQPPLVFAVTRLLGAPEAGYEMWADWVRAHEEDTVAECARRSIQTNEPLRCAALLPALDLIPGPVALLEVGASAGLCLYPDRYSYRYATAGGLREVDPSDGVSPVVLASELVDVPLPTLPEVVWRAGIDLVPLRADDPDDRAFLTALVWPGETGRIERIAAALDLVAADPPHLVAGDATDPEQLRALAAAAPRDAALVVTTPGVLPHIPRAGRERLIDTVRALDAHWVTIDPPGLHEAAKNPTEHPPASPARRPGFVLALDGTPLAEVDPLGASVRGRASHR